MGHPRQEYEIGMRVGAIQSMDGKQVRLYGYGVYEGDFLPPGATHYTAEEIREIDPEWVETHSFEELEQHLEELNTSPMLSNPRIKLDNGKTVWGFQCWWGPEDEVRESIGTREVVIVDIEETADTE